MKTSKTFLNGDITKSYLNPQCLSFTGYKQIFSCLLYLGFWGSNLTKILVVCKCHKFLEQLLVYVGDVEVMSKPRGSMLIHCTSIRRMLWFCGLIITPCRDECREHACLVGSLPGDQYWVIAFHPCRNHWHGTTGTIWLSVPPSYAQQGSWGQNEVFWVVVLINKLVTSCLLLDSNHKF